MFPKSVYSLIIKRNFFKAPKSNHTEPKSYLKKYIKWTLVGSTVGSIGYDACNDFEVYDGLARFLRSLKIAALISIDYSWNLYGLGKGTEIYEQVQKHYFPYK